ncbi:hypothetical protein [Rasiella sp. SM2506]|uniref:hypothetical protein n=1 Tax=Rasiella sp. SM2506 TaxID=3423914 RepID=UPI003D7BA9AA
MSIFQITILVVVFLMTIVSILVFYFQKKKERHIHLQAILLSTNAIAKNKYQIKVRQTHLGTYDFLKQNITDALLVQQEIDIRC